MNMQPNITLRKAQEADMGLIDYWDTKEHVKFSVGGEIDEDDDWLEEQIKNPSEFVWIYIAEANGRPIGVVQIIDPLLEESHYWGEVEPNCRAIDIWIGEESDLSKGYGTEMMRQAIEICFADKSATKILIDPLVINTRAIKFYERCGFKYLETRIFDGSECYVMCLERTKG